MHGFPISILNSELVKIDPSRPLQVQGKAAEDVRDILYELIQNNLLVADSSEDTAEHNIDTVTINVEHLLKRTTPYGSGNWLCLSFSSSLV